MSADLTPEDSEDSEAINESCASFHGAWRGFARRSATGEVRALPEVGIASSNVPWAMLNAAFLPGPVRGEPELVRAATAAAHYFLPRQRAWMLTLCEDWVPPALRARVPALLAPLGLKPSVVAVGMLAERLLPGLHPPPHLRVLPTSEPRARTDLADINSRCYDVPLSTGRRVFDVPALFDGDSRGFVGYRQEQAATCAAVLRVEGVAYVSMVATLAAHRRLGCAEAIMRHALTAAHRAWGLERTVLHATPEGLPVYRRMGYREVTRFYFYLAPPSLPR